MAKFVYAVGVQNIYSYTVQEDGSLLPLGTTPADGYILAYCNNAKYAQGDNYLFTAGSDSLTGVQGIDVYHVEKDGSLNQVVDHYTKGMDQLEGAVSTAFTAMQWPQTAGYFAYISAYMPSTPGDAGTEILGYRFTPPGNMEYIGNTTSNLPPFLEGNVTALQSVTDHGPHGDETAPRIYAVYADRKAESTYAASFSSSAFGKLSYQNSGELSIAGGIFLAVSPNQKFLYIGYMSDIAEGSPAGNPAAVFGFRIEKDELIPIGNTEIPGELMAIETSPDGKYLFAGMGNGAVFALPIGPDGKLKNTEAKMSNANAFTRPANKTGGGMAGLAVDPDGQYVYYVLGAYIYVHKIEADGKLSPVPGVDGEEELGDLVIFEV